jgi:hypothetical protein
MNIRCETNDDVCFTKCKTATEETSLYRLEKPTKLGFLLDAVADLALLR